MSKSILKNKSALTAILIENTVVAEPKGFPCIVVFSGPELGRRYFLDRPKQTIGRSETADIFLEDWAISRRHVDLVIKGQRTLLYDLGSTNGTYVNEDRVATRELQSGDMIRIGQTVFKYLAAATTEETYHEQIYRLITTDALTGVFNRAYFLRALRRELSRVERHDRILSLVFFDIDNFKDINDTLGHLAGDYVLKEMASIVGANLRDEDILARYGGDEFAIILTDTDADGARQVCEKLTGLVQAHPFLFAGSAIHITISVGARTAVPGPDAFDHMQLIADADAKLYEAKQAGPAATAPNPPSRPSS